MGDSIKTSSSRNQSPKLKDGDKDDKTKKDSIQPESLPTKINRRAVIRDLKVEKESMVLAQKGEDESMGMAEDVEKEVEEPINITDDNKVRSSQMNSIRKTLTKESNKEKRKREEEDDDEIKVLSYKDVRPKTRVGDHVRIVRKFGSSGQENAAQRGGKKRHASSSPDKSKKKVFNKVIEKERIVRKVYEVEKNVDGVSNIEKVTMEKSVKETSKIRREEQSVT